MAQKSGGTRFRKLTRRILLFLTRKHHWMRGSYGEYLLVTLFLIAATVVLTNFVALNITSQLFTPGPGDATAGFLWLNFADPGLSPFLTSTDIANYPSGQQLGSATFVTYLALWLPMRFLSFLFGPVAALNLMTFFGFISAGLSMYWLVKRLSNSWVAAIFAGYATAFVPYAIGKSSAHIAYIFSVVFVLMLAAFIALWSRPTFKRGLLFGCTVTLGFYTDGYYVLLGAVMVAGLCLAGIFQGVLLRFKWPDYWTRLKALLGALAALVVLSAPIAYVQFMQGDQVRNALISSRPDIEPEIRAYRSNVMDFIVPPASNPLFKDSEAYKQVQAYKNLRSNSSENLNYVGFTVIFLMAVGVVLMVVWVVSRKYSSLKAFDQFFRTKYILVASIAIITIPLFLAFMFSPEVVIKGVTIPLPGKIFIDYDIALWRVMSRFFVPLHVIAVLFASLTLWIIISKVKGMRFGRHLGAGIGLLALVIVAMEFATLVNRPSFSFVSSIPPTYRWLEEQKDVSVVAEAPFVYPHDVNATRYFTAQIVHGKKLINEKETTNSSLVNNIGSVGNPEMIDWAYARGAQLVITHGTKCDDVKWGKLLYEDYSDRFGGQLCTYKLERSMTRDRSFVRFFEGFKFFSETDQHSWGIGIEKPSVRMDIINEQFHARTGEAYLTASLAPLFNESIEGTWELRQKGKPIASGEISESQAQLEARIDAAAPLELIISPKNGQYTPSGLKITKTIITSF